VEEHRMLIWHTEYHNNW